MNNGKLTDELQSEICKYIEIGMPAKHACSAVGICEVTYYDWIKKGSEQKTGKYAKFLKSIKKAKHRHEARNAAIIEKKAQDGTWQAAAWMLERRHSNDWGNKQFQKIEHSGKINFTNFKELMKDDE